MDYGIQPFWFWNGDIDEKGIRNQIEAMYTKAVRGFIICARQGLKVPYLSQRWFDLVAYAVEEARQRDMTVWLYDEQPYPSGISGGKVILDHPEYEAKELKVEIIDAEGDLLLDLEWGKIIFAKAYPLENITEQEGEWHIKDPSNAIDLVDQIGSLFAEEVYHEVGLTIYNRKRFLACNTYNQLSVSLPEGRYKVVIFNEVPVRGHKYYDRFIDPLNPACVRYFIETTHEAYKRHLGHEFGKTIKGIFTDEIHPIGYEDHALPWSPLMPELYEKATGRNLYEDIIGLKFRLPNETDLIRYQYMNVIVDGFIDAYDKQIQNWCHSNDLKYIGEKPILRSAQLEYMDIPGIDAGHQKAGAYPDVMSARYRANGKLVASAAHFYGKERCLCESFHSIGWGMEIQDMKWTYDWLLVQGVTMFVNHAYFYTTHGLKKHDAPASGFYQMPWWQHQKQLSDYCRRMSQLIAESTKQIRVILLDPITSTWTKPTVEGRNKIKDQFEALQRDLYREGIDFYIMDPRLLSRVKVNEGKLHYIEETYDYLILPFMSNIESCALTQVVEMVKQKGYCYAIGDRPYEVIELDTAVDLEQLRGTFYYCENNQSLIERLKEEGVETVSVTLNGEKAQEIWLNHLNHEGERYCFVANVTKECGEIVIKAGGWYFLC